MRYLITVSVLPAVDYQQSVHPQFGEPESCTIMEAKQCTAVNVVSSKMHFSQLNEGPLKFKFKCTIFRIFSVLYLAARQPFPLELHFLRRRTSIEVLISLCNIFEAVVCGGVYLLIALQAIDKITKTFMICVSEKDINKK